MNRYNAEVFLDSRKLDKSHIGEFDLCVIGAGAAGIAIAREFIGTGRKLCLIESGGFTYNNKIEDLYSGTTEGPIVKDEFLLRTRLRMFGGSTMHWEGYCRPMDEYDFQAKPWLEHYRGWPFQRKALEPYYDRACKIVKIKPFFSEGPDRLPFYNKDVALVTLPFHISPPVRFGAAYREQLAKADNVSVYLFANARELVPAGSHDHIGSLQVISNAGNHFTLNAKHYILCTGGIENARVLLNSNSVMPAGVGNDNGLVGRFFMTHYPIPGFGKGIIVHKDTAAITRELLQPTIRYLSLREDVKRDLKLMNAGFHLDPGYRFKTPGRFPDSMRKVLPYFAAFLRGNTRYKVFPMLAVGEQCPDPNNRVVLEEARDATGMRRTRLELRPVAEDMESLHQSSHRFATEIGRHLLGRIQTMFYDDNKPVLRPDDHHMGTTRMDRDPKFGVVDEHCRVHGIDNLFIAGSSVFPSGGFANPTLTLLALALRLCDHIKELPA